MVESWLKGYSTVFSFTAHSLTVGVVGANSMIIHFFPCILCIGYTIKNASNFTKPTAPFSLVVYIIKGHKGDSKQKLTFHDDLSNNLYLVMEGQGGH